MPRSDRADRLPRSKFLHALRHAVFALAGGAALSVSGELTVARAQNSTSLTDGNGGGINTRLFRGAGFGVSLITPLGPIGLDLAYGFDRTNVLGQPAPGWKLHFKIGNFF